VAVALALSVRLVNGLLKLIVDSPRPTDDHVAVPIGSSGLGYPSGHSSGALLVVGAIAWSLARREERHVVRWLIWSSAIVWIALTGIGRIRVGAHWPSDVLGAWLWALPALALITRIATRMHFSAPATTRDDAFARARVLLMIGLLAVFAELAVEARGPSVLPGDVRVARWVQGRDWPLLEPLTDIANWSMRTAPLAIGVALVLCFLALRGMRTDVIVLLVAGLLTVLSYPLKEQIASPRPTPELIDVVGDPSGYGFPGGRAGNAVLVAGAIAWIAARRLESTPARRAIWFAAVLWIALAGVARVRVGAHWPSDILGAWLWTTPALLILVSLAENRRQRSDTAQS
jgi:undecaprenyl-diphosphatase